MTGDSRSAATGKTGGLSQRAPMARVDDFLNPDDPRLFPRLTEAQIGHLAVIADNQLLVPGEGCSPTPNPATQRRSRGCGL
jgi:hypothetical protein